MTTERIKEIQSATPYPESQSVQQALLQVWNEVEQESRSATKTCYSEGVSQPGAVADVEKFFEEHKKEIDYQIKANIYLAWRIPPENMKEEIDRRQLSYSYNYMIDKFLSDKNNQVKLLEMIATASL